MGVIVCVDFMFILCMNTCVNMCVDMCVTFVREYLSEVDVCIVV